jgi:hypothetical protein
MFCQILGYGSTRRNNEKSLYEPASDMVTSESYGPSEFYNVSGQQPVEHTLGSA